MAELPGVKIHLDPWVNEKDVFVIFSDGVKVITMHGSTRARGKKSKKPHGRTNGPKYRRSYIYRYAPMYDRVYNDVVESMSSLEGRGL